MNTISKKDRKPGGGRKPIPPEKKRVMLSCRVKPETFDAICRKAGQESIGRLLDKIFNSEIPNDLKEAVKNYIYKAADSPGDNWTTDDIRKAYIAGYKLHEANTPLPEDTVIYNKGVEEGKRLMMEEAVEGEVVQDLKGVNRVKSFGKIPEGLHFGDKVRIIILPKED